MSVDNLCSLAGTDACRSCTSNPFCNDNTKQEPMTIVGRMTNADRFRAKTDQELAKTFEDFGVCPPHPCPYSDTDKPLTRDDCLECHLEWLKAEVEE